MPKIIRRFTYKNSNVGWGDIKYIDFYDDGGCYYVYVDGSKKDIGDSYTIKTCEDLCQGNDNWKEVPLEDTPSMVDMIEGTNILEVVPKGKIRYFKAGPKGTPWGSVDYVEYHYDTGDLWHVKNGKKENHHGQYSLKEIEVYVKDGYWEEIFFNGKDKEKKKRTYGEVKASDNHYHRILVRKGTKAIVKNGYVNSGKGSGYYSSKYFVVDILTGIVEELCNTFKEAKEALKDES